MAESTRRLLTEIFSYDGFGTMVYSNEYQQIRRIFKKDVRSVMSLIRQSVQSEELVRRTRAEILERLEDYWLLEVDRTPVACVALHVYPQEAAGELACLYVSKAHENQGYGRKLMAFRREPCARERSQATLCALDPGLQLSAAKRRICRSRSPNLSRRNVASSMRPADVIRKSSPSQLHGQLR